MGEVFLVPARLNVTRTHIFIVLSVYIRLHPLYNGAFRNLSRAQNQFEHSIRGQKYAYEVMSVH